MAAAMVVLLKAATSRRSLCARWLAVTLVSAACAPAIRRDLSQIPAGRVGFDDLCGVQTYFDRLAMKIGEPPAVVSATEVQGRGQPQGRSRFRFETEFQLQAVRQILAENWKRLPDDITTASRIDIEVRWAERSGVRRVVTNEDAELTVGGSPSPLALPYHVCLSELLFGEPLYQQRRVALGLGPLPSPPAIVGTAFPVPDAGLDGSVDTLGASPIPGLAPGPTPAPAPAPAPVTSPAPVHSLVPSPSEGVAGSAGITGSRSRVDGGTAGVGRLAPR